MGNLVFGNEIETTGSNNIIAMVEHLEQVLQQRKSNNLNEEIARFADSNQTW